MIEQRHLTFFTNELLAFTVYKMSMVQTLKLVLTPQPFALSLTLKLENLQSYIEVQSLLLMVQYLQSTQKSIQTWSVHGLAVKAAFQLGLHSPDVNNQFPPLEREVRKRTWFGSVIL